MTLALLCAGLIAAAPAAYDSVNDPNPAPVTSSAVMSDAGIAVPDCGFWMTNVACPVPSAIT